MACPWIQNKSRVDQYSCHTFLFFPNPGKVLFLAQRSQKLLWVTICQYIYSRELLRAATDLPLSLGGKRGLRTILSDRKESPSTPFSSGLTGVFWSWLHHPATG